MAARTDRLSQATTLRPAHALVRTLAAGLGIVLALWLGTIGLVLLAGSRHRPHHADAIMVLGAAQYNGRPSPVLKARLDYALELWRGGWAPRLVVTGGVGRRDTLSEADVARRYALAHGVPADAILIERAGVTSAQSVFAAAAILRAHGVRRALLVSDPFHMMRLELLSLKAGILPYAAPTPMSRIEASPNSRWRYVLRESVLVPATALLGSK
ncbi:MAG TPA: YdcF family protein [Longimicrobiales bacterium]|nr:YdcF family protein [Longimicrobiales bacterium]